MYPHDYIIDSFSGHFPLSHHLASDFWAYDIVKSQVTLGRYEEEGEGTTATRDDFCRDLQITVMTVYRSPPCLGRTSFEVSLLRDLGLRLLHVACYCGLDWSK